MRPTPRLAAAALLLTASAGLAVAQPGNKPQGNSRANNNTAQPATNRTSNNAANTNNAAPTGDIWIIHSAGLSEMLGSPKDAGLLAAMDLVPPRLVELLLQTNPGAMNGGPDPEDVVDLLWSVMASPMTLRVAATEPGESGEPPFAFNLESRPEDAERLQRSLLSMIRESDGPRPRTIEGGYEFDSPMGPARMGVEDDAWTFAVGPALPAAAHDWSLPEGYTPVFGVHLNLQNAQPLIEMALSQSPESDQVRPMLEGMGVIGDNALILDMAVGHDEHEAVIRGTLHGARNHAAGLGMPTDVTLDREFLSLIPADATYVSAGVFDLGMIDQMMEVPEVQEGLEQVSQEMGIDLKGDVIDQIGNRFAIYQSDTTGGGGMLSMVAILELNDGRAFARAHGRLIDAANDFAGLQAQMATNGIGGVEIRPRRQNGIEFFTLTFPGLPIPAEVSWTIHGDHLMLALSPRSLVEAMNQAGDAGGASFADNPMLAAMAGREGGASLLTVNYADAPRFARQGYSLVGLAMAGVSNALRTQGGEDPGIPMPGFNDFIEGIEPNMSVSYWDGEDLRFNGRMDASMLVNLAGSSGAAMGPLAIGSMAGVLLPALGEARESARQVKSQAQLRQIVMTMHIYAADYRDRLPESIDDLGEYLGDSSILTSPVGPAFDGGPDYAIRTDLGGENMARIADPARTLAAIDRASVLNGADMIIVGFMDGHVEAIPSWQLSEYLAMEANHGAFEAFGLPEWMNPGF